MDAIHLGLWLLCGLGTAVFAAIHPLSRRHLAVAVAAYGVAAWWTVMLSPPSASPLGSIVALGAALSLTRTPKPVYLAALAGLLAGAWVGVATAARVPLAAAAVAAAIVPFASAMLRARAPQFAPREMREDALIFMVCFGLIVAAAPTVAEGWRAAGNLKLQSADSRPVAFAVMPTWTLVLSSAALMCGGLYSLWSRR
jgi:hypothetical protein